MSSIHVDPDLLETHITVVLDRQKTLADTAQEVAAIINATGITEVHVNALGFGQGILDLIEHNSPNYIEVIGHHDGTDGLA